MANKIRMPGRRTQAESEHTKVRILDCSETLFARRGFGGVSLRELAAGCDVKHGTIQHHFGSKLGLYQAVLLRWNAELESRLAAVTAGKAGLAEVVEHVAEELFDFLLAKREWVTLTARTVTGEELPQGVELNDRSWLRFIKDTTSHQQLAGQKMDLGLLLISVEGILNNHVLARAHYQELYGKDVTDPKLNRRTKEHIKTVLSAVLGAN